MALYELHETGVLVAPVMIAAFDGWVNAGEAGTRAAEVIAAGGDLVATFDSDALFDYRANRPSMFYLEGVMEDITWPEMSLRHTDHGGRDLLILTGTEPNWHWQQLASEIADLATDLGVVEQISLGGIPWAAPHTRPVSTIITASDRSRIDPDSDHPEGQLVVPGAAVTAIAHAVTERGIPTIGFWARVPHYLGSVHHAAALALLDRVAIHLGVPLPVAAITEEAAEQSRQLDAIAEGRPEVQTLIEQLEGLTDQREVTGEDLAAEIERYLRDQDEPR
jgi:proteasome assembly chaperone (PAC2) family protein